MLKQTIFSNFLNKLHAYEDIHYVKSSHLIPNGLQAFKLVENVNNAQLTNLMDKFLDFISEFAKCFPKSLPNEVNNTYSLIEHSKKQEIINQELNLKNEIIKMVNKDLQCPICNEWLLKATSVNCNHTFCEVCIRKWININKACPICRTSIQYTTTSIAVDNFISNLCQLFGGSIKERRESIRNAHKDATDHIDDDRINYLNQSIQEDTFLSQFETTIPQMTHPNMVPIIPFSRITEMPVSRVNSSEPLNHPNRFQLSPYIPIVSEASLSDNDPQPTSEVDVPNSSSIDQSIEEDTFSSQLEIAMPSLRHPNVVPLIPFPRVTEIPVSRMNSHHSNRVQLSSHIPNVSLACLCINDPQPISEINLPNSSSIDQSIEEDTYTCQLETNMLSMRHPNMVPLIPFPCVSETRASYFIPSIESIESLQVNRLLPTSSTSEDSSLVRLSFDQSIE